MHLILFSSDDEAGRSRLGCLLATTLLVGVIAALLLRSIFFVDETEFVSVTEFGKPVRFYGRPGLGLKWPYQSVRRFDRRLQIYEPPGREMLTEDKENLTFEWFVCWRIPDREFARQELIREQFGADPTDADIQRQVAGLVQRFLQSLGSLEAAENRLEERIQAAVAAEIGRTRFVELCALDGPGSHLDAISQRVIESVRGHAAEQFGIEVVDIRLKRFNYPSAVKPAVYAEIRSERQRIAVQYRAEGASEKDRIESLADLQREQLLAEARRDAAEIRGQGDAKAIEIYNAAHSKDPQFYELLKTLETYRSILDQQTTVVLSANSPLLRLLRDGLPSSLPADASAVTRPVAEPAKTAESR